MTENAAAPAVTGVHHEANPGQPFRESQTGLDHIAFGVAERGDRDSWAGWLDEFGISLSGVIDTDNPMLYSVVVFRPGQPGRNQSEKVGSASCNRAARPFGCSQISDRPKAVRSSSE